jgi:hypothetical protein
MTEPISDEALAPIAAAVAHAIEGLGVIPMVQSFDRVADMHVALSPQGMAGILARLTAAEAERDRLRKALERIERWFGEFPDTGERWNDGTPMSYAAAYGSNGERDYMRGIARAALSPEPEPEPEPSGNPT